MQYKRDLFEHNAIQIPSWLNFVGSIHQSDFHKIESYLFHSTSNIERSYFIDVKFFKLKANVKVKSCLVQIVPQTFLSCKNTFKDNTDYHSSSNSIYKPDSFCIQEGSLQLISYSADTKGISQKRDMNNLISISLNAKNALCDTKYDTVQSILKRVVNFNKVYSDKEIIVSVGAGSGITELSSSKLTLCLDKNKRSIFTGLSQVKNGQSKNTTIFAHFDYSKQIAELLQSIKEAYPAKLIRLLLQHPNPSIEEANRSALSLLFKSVIISLKQGVLHDVTFVYDSSTSRFNWSKSDILSLFMSNTNSSNYNVTNEVLVSSKGNNNVSHPLFGKTKRFGWAAMRNCNEYTFSISHMNIN